MIDELEPVKRGPTAAPSAICATPATWTCRIYIRTAIFKDGMLHVQAGGGTSPTRCRPTRGARDRGQGGAPYARAVELARGELGPDAPDHRQLRLLHLQPRPVPGRAGAELDVVRNDKRDGRTRWWSGDPIRRHLARPVHAGRGGRLVEAIRHVRGGQRPGAGRLPRAPVLAAFGGRVVRGEPMHGKTDEIAHDGRTIFARPPNPRGHPLPLARRGPRPAPRLEISACSGATIMGIRHRSLPAEGVQFHPESVLTADGKAMLRNFLEG